MVQDIKKVELEKVSIQLIDKNILLVTIQKNHTIEIEDIKEMRITSLQMSNEKKYALILIGEFNTSVSTEARGFMAQPNSLDNYRICMSMITRDLPHRLLANFYLKFNKPSVPTKVFSNIEEAILWSKTQLNQ